MDRMNRVWKSKRLARIATAAAVFALQGCGPSLQDLSAGKIGASPGEIGISNEETGFGSKTWIATHDGVDYQCARNALPASGVVAAGAGRVGAFWGTTMDVSCAPMNTTRPREAEPRSAGPRQDGKEPKGAVGFSFGGNVQDAEKTCTDAGFSWKGTAQDRFSCSGSPIDFGIPAEVRVRYCYGKICEITVDANVDQAPWQKLAGRYRSILATLEGRYGDRYKQTSDPLDDCSGDIKSCFATGRTRTSAIWKWPIGQSVSAVLDGGPLGGRPLLEVVYRIGLLDIQRPGL